MSMNLVHRRNGTFGSRMIYFNYGLRISQCFALAIGLTSCNTVHDASMPAQVRENSVLADIEALKSQYRDVTVVSDLKLETELWDLTVRFYELLSAVAGVDKFNHIYRCDDPVDIYSSFLDSLRENIEDCEGRAFMVFENQNGSITVWSRSRLVYEPLVMVSSEGDVTQTAPRVRFKILEEYETCYDPSSGEFHTSIIVN